MKKATSARTAIRSGPLTSGMTVSRLRPASCADGDELIAACAQPIDDLGQGRNGLITPSAAVMKQDDVAAALFRRGEYFPHASLRRCASTPGVRQSSGSGVQADDRITGVLRQRGRLQLVCLGRLGVAEIGRAEQACRSSGISLDQALRVAFSSSLTPSGDSSARLGCV